MGLDLSSCPANGKLTNGTSFVKWYITCLAEVASKTLFSLCSVLHGLVLHMALC